MAEAKKTILVVDDEPDTVEFVKTIIQEMGDFCVMSAFDGESGLEKAKTELPDLVILDVMMPKKIGFEVFYDLRRNPGTEHIPVIMLTGVSEQIGMKYSKEAMGEFYGKEPEEFIDKPIEPSAIQDAIKSALGL